ncbi:tetraspanin-7-like [Ylistrum balloti]|uniref:tetraspanin-7-like n=1 Tax=Ylistrum balloti TaxID=509963 RepID=UPI002905EB76|nr:tetraspanin-7-like [Ylistrum balloti]
MAACRLATVVRCVMITVNSLFVVLGVMVLCIGCILITGGNLTGGYLVALFSALPEVSGSIGSFFTYVAATIIIVGAAIFVLGTLGCCGACNINPRLLYTVDDRLKEAFQTTINNEYGGPDVTDSISNAWNYAFVTYKCCGITNYTDLHLAVKWNRTGSSDVIPVTCCVLPGSYPNYGNPADAACTTTPTESNANISKGCYDKIKSFLETYVAYVIGIGSAILFLELMTVISAFLLSRQRKKTGPLPAEKDVDFR